MNPQTSKSLKSSYILLHIRSYTFDCFFRVLDSTKIKFGEKSVQIITNISNLFLVLLRRLESSSSPFYDLNKMATNAT